MPAPSQKGGRAVLGGSLLFLAILIGFILGGLSAYFYLGENEAKPTTDTSSSRKGAELDSDKVPALGRIEPRDGILSLGVPVPDRITKIRVKEGQRVKSGEQLVDLESEALRRLEEKASEIQVDEAEKRRKAIRAAGKAQIRVEDVRLQQAKQLSPLELEGQQSKIEFLRIQEANAKRDYERLVKTGDTIAKQDIEKQKLLWRQAQEELNAAEKQYQRLLVSQPLDFQMADARREAAQAELERSQSTISQDLLSNQTAQAKARREAARIIAPSDGTILRLLAREGELVQGRPILQMANLDKIIVVAEVPTTFIPRIQLKDKATITSSVFTALGYEQLEGEVYSIGEIVGKPQVTNPDPLATTDYRIVQVKILLNQNEPAARYIGHEVDVSIYPKKQTTSKH
ncbi:MAG TPA: efflux RND transporter periplasmic adaptor subunit [Gemmataceae bacterium]|jgi:HlyD family secretion protein